jgi:hypothetical protein
MYKHSIATATTAGTGGSSSSSLVTAPTKSLYSSDDTPVDPTSSTTTTENPPVVALLVSQSAFTDHCLRLALGSPLPLLLIHLPPNSAGEIGSGIGAAFGNPALLSATGVLRGELEIRWERGGGVAAAALSPSGMLDSSGRPGLWWQGQPLPSWTPDAEAPYSTANDSCMLATRCSQRCGTAAISFNALRLLFYVYLSGPCCI